MRSIKGFSAARHLLAVVSVWLGTAHAEPIQVGQGKLEFANNGEPIEVFTYKPAAYRDGPLILVFHGVNRNAEDYRDFAISMANRFNAIVAAPLFDKDRFGSDRYQRGGLFAKGKLQPREMWTFALIPRLAEDLRARERKPTLPYFLVGHSAGGQFLVRLAAFYPGQARRIVAANPGSQLFPTRESAFGYGFGTLPPELSDDEALRRYLAAPLTLYLGTADIDPDDKNLDRSPLALAQGKTRYERGVACFAFAQELATRRGWEFGWRKVETPGIGHNAAQMFAAKESLAAVLGSE